MTKFMYQIDNKAFLDIIACPLCKGKLYYDKNREELLCRFDRLAYPVVGGIPVMLVDKARDLQESEGE